MKAAKPNLPKNTVKKLIVSQMLCDSAKKMFADLDISLIYSPLWPMTDKRLSYHVDIGICHADVDTLVVCPSGYEYFKDICKNVIEGKNEPGSGYPDDALYNVCVFGDYAVHNFKYTDPALLDVLEKRYELIDVNQGYSKCALSVINENFVITQDKGIAKILERRGLGVLHIDEKNIFLRGFSYGFIGGTSLMLNNNTWLLNGSQKALDSCYNITKELGYRAVDIKCLCDEAPKDVGSFIALFEEENYDEKVD